MSKRRQMVTAQTRAHHIINSCNLMILHRSKSVSHIVVARARDCAHHHSRHNPQQRTQSMFRKSLIAASHILNTLNPIQILPFKWLRKKTHKRNTKRRWSQTKNSISFDLNIINFDVKIPFTQTRLCIWFMFRRTSDPNVVFQCYPSREGERTQEKNCVHRRFDVHFYWVATLLIQMTMQRIATIIVRLCCLFFSLSTSSSSVFKWHTRPRLVCSWTEIDFFGSRPLVLHRISMRQSSDESVK